MATAAVRAAGVAFAVMMLTVMIAFDSRIISKLARKQSLDSFVARAGNTAAQRDACLCKCHLCAAANTAADQKLRTEILEKRGKRAVSAAVGVINLCGNNISVFHFIELEFRCVAEMLEDLAVFVCNCNFHFQNSPFYIVMVIPQERYCSLSIYCFIKSNGVSPVQWQV